MPFIVVDISKLGGGVMVILAAPEGTVRFTVKGCENDTPSAQLWNADGVLAKVMVCACEKTAVKPTRSKSKNFFIETDLQMNPSDSAPKLAQHAYMRGCNGINDMFLLVNGRRLKRLCSSQIQGNTRSILSSFRSTCFNVFSSL